ncbi:MAG: tRNA threonylcarbamoyladenosine biosynthesis protein TsaB [Phycisphaerae bacterium]|nr:tRNA threonylcarbamoyladenosine biosynthesis protein TsaB [Phycisphaerae bacterium]
MNPEQRSVALETSSQQGSIALAAGGHTLQTARFRTTNNHAQELLPTAQQLCRRQRWSISSLEMAYLSIGPGSFTGLRIAVSMARTLAWSVGLRLVAVPSLAVIARNALSLPQPPAELVTLLDAKRSQIYAAHFRLMNGVYIEQRAARLCHPAELLSEVGPTAALIGEGLRYHQSAIAPFRNPIMPEEYWWPKAEEVVTLGWAAAQRGEFTARQHLQPLYLRLPEAEEVWQKKHGTVDQGAG